MAQRTRITLWSTLFVLLVTSGVPLSYAQTIQTPSEKIGFQEYTSYEDMMQYLKDIQATTTEMALSSFGQTIEGREQPYAIFSYPTLGGHDKRQTDCGPCRQYSWRRTNGKGILAVDHQGIRNQRHADERPSG